MNDPKRLAEVIRKMHGCTATYLRSEPVTEPFKGQTVWDGVVEVFAISGDSRASTAYGWTYRADDGTTHHLAVLGVPPIKCAVDAVRAAVVAESRKVAP